MPDIPYVKVSAIYKKLKEAEKDHRVIYISGAVGFGKTTAVTYFYRKKDVLFLSGEEGYLSDMPAEEDIMQDVIVIDDISWITDKDSQNYILHMIQNSQKHLVLIGRGRVPSWMQLVSVEQHFLLADERDLTLNEGEIRKFFLARRIEPTEGELKEIMALSKGCGLVLHYIAYHMEGGVPYSEVVEEKMRQDIFHYYDHAFFEKWNHEMREVLLALCQYPHFTVEMAEMITGNNRIPYLLEYALTVGSFLIMYSDGSYQCRYTLGRYLRWKQAIVYTKEQIIQNYERAALYYEIHNQMPEALKYYEAAGSQKNISRLLIKNAEQHPGTGHFFETREYYYKLPEETIRKSPILMSGMSMLYALTFQPERSNRWYKELETFEAAAERGSEQQKEARIRLAYLDIALPQKGIHGIIDILKNTAILCRNKNVKLPEFSVTSNLPSITNGGLDFCEWSKNDKELAVLMKKPIEMVLGKYGVGLVNIALAESGFEKGTMDTYEVMTRLNTGYMMADTEGKIEMCFAAIGLIVKLHLAQGQPKVAAGELRSFREKVLQEELTQILPNLDAMEMWIQILEGKMDAAKQWLEKAPNEKIAFCILDRYQYIQKVRCLIALKNYTEAAALVERLNVYFTRYERNYLWMENQTLKAIIQYRIGNPEWEDTLDQAFKKMEHYHFIRIAGQEGIALKPLMDEMNKYTVSEKFFKLLKKEVDKIARYYPEYIGEEKRITEPLTSMEHHILDMLCSGQSSEVICDTFGFTYSTLKFHNRNIYRKLGVKNRKEAEKVARRLSLSEE